MVSNHEDRLAAAGIELPPAVTPFGAYVPAVQTGKLLFLSGMLPILGKEVLFAGRIGEELTVQEGREAARAAALNALAVARQHLGSLNPIKRVVKVAVYIATAGNVGEMPRIADGASELLRDVFGADTLPVRVVLGVACIPLGVPIELEVLFELES